MLLFLYVTEEAGRKYVRDMPWPPAAECNMITNKQTMRYRIAAIVFVAFLGDDVFLFPSEELLRTDSLPLREYIINTFTTSRPMPITVLPPTFFVSTSLHPYTALPIYG